MTLRIALRQMTHTSSVEEFTSRYVDADERNYKLYQRIDALTVRRAGSRSGLQSHAVAAAARYARSCCSADVLVRLVARNVRDAVARRPPSQAESARLESELVNARSALAVASRMSSMEDRDRRGVLRLFDGRIAAVNEKAARCAR